MADPRGFLKVRERELPPYRPVPVRLKDYRDVVAERTREPDELGTVERQAGRCMDCGIPFCHSGCPLGNLIPEWNHLVWSGQWAEASDRLHATNNFPEFTGKICPAPCETSCVLGINAPPVTIKNVEITIVEEAFARGLITPQVPHFLTGQTVAVVGSGPSGLAAAQQLTRAGHTVAVFERADRIGGLLRYGVPDFKLEKRLIDRRIAQMEAEGTRFRTGVEVGKDITWTELLARYDAVLVDHRLDDAAPAHRAGLRPGRRGARGAVPHPEQQGPGRGRRAGPDHRDRQARRGDRRRRHRLGLRRHLAAARRHLGDLAGDRRRSRPWSGRRTSPGPPTR